MTIIEGANDAVYAMAWFNPSLHLSRRWSWYDAHVHAPLFRFFYLRQKGRRL